MRDIAAADEHEVVRGIYEFYADFFPINQDLVSLNVYDIKGLYYHPISDRSDKLKYDRIKEGILSLLLAYRSKPFVRFQSSSKLCSTIASDICKSLQMNFDILDGPRLNDESLLLIVDRKEDPVTPLLSQWTYQAMLHELIGMNNNRVDLSSLKHNQGKKQNIEDTNFVLSSEHDAFFKTAMYLNFGDLGVSIKQLVEKYQETAKQEVKLDSVEDIQKFIDEYGSKVSLSGSVKKHVNIMHELNTIVDERNLMKVSALEQSLACEQDHNSAVERVRELLKDRTVQFRDKLRIVMLYALRYEQVKNELSTFKSILRDLAGETENSEQVRVKFHFIYTLLFKLFSLKGN